MEGTFSPACSYMLIDSASILALVVTYKTWPWSQIFLNSFRTHLPELPLLVVNNNASSGSPSCTAEDLLEEDWYSSHSNVTVLKPEQGQYAWSGKYTHGAGVDLAVSYARSNGYKYVLHLEPDCLISSSVWFEQMVDILASGYWLIGSHKKLYGSIHPTPSLWDLAHLNVTFDQIERGSDELHPRFNELFDLTGLLQHCKELKYAPPVVEWFRKTWDTGQKAWFYAACENKAVCLTTAPGFRHYWSGSTNGPDLQKFPELLDYL